MMAKTISLRLVVFQNRCLQRRTLDIFWPNAISAIQLHISKTKNLSSKKLICAGGDESAGFPFHSSLEDGLCKANGSCCVAKTLAFSSSPLSGGTHMSA